MMPLDDISLPPLSGVSFYFKEKYCNAAAWQAYENSTQDITNELLEVVQILYETAYICMLPQTW
jgi:hypothetical protein